MIELEKMRGLTSKNLRNLAAYWIIEILLILCSVYIVTRD